jgi:hypothetical protein
MQQVCERQTHTIVSQDVCGLAFFAGLAQEYIRDLATVTFPRNIHKSSRGTKSPWHKVVPLYPFNNHPPPMYLDVLYVCTVLISKKHLFTFTVKKMQCPLISMNKWKNFICNKSICRVYCFCSWACSHEQMYSHPVVGKVTVTPLQSYITSYFLE